MRYFITILLLCVGVNVFSQREVLGSEYNASAHNPYKIVCDGNSLTFGANFSAGSDSSYPKKLGVLLPAARVMNFGVNGQLTLDMINDYASEIAPQYRADSFSVLVAWEIGNTIWVGWPTDTAKNQIQRYCEMGRATGYKVIVATAPYRGVATFTPGGDNQATYNAKLDTVNNWVRSNYTSWADAIVNMDQDNRVNDFNDTTYRDADKIHYKGPGYQVIATLVKNQIITL